MNRAKYLIELIEKFKKIKELEKWHSSKKNDTNQQKNDQIA